MEKQDQGTINFIELDRLIGDEKRVLVIAPRCTGLTMCIELEMQLLKTRKPWLTIKYISLPNVSGKEFIERKYPFTYDSSKTKACFVDHGLVLSMESIRSEVDFGDCNQRIYFFSTLNTIDDGDERVRELVDYGFKIIRAPLLYTRPDNVATGGCIVEGALMEDCIKEYQ